MDKMDRKEIAKLVARVRNGDKDAFAELIKPIENTLMGIARQNTRNEDDAKDVVQMAMINAYFKIHKLNDNEKFNNWIYKITRNCCKKLYQKRKKIDQYIDESADINEATYYEEEPLNIDHILRLLSEKEQEIFKLHHIDGLTTKQISKILDMNENTIKTHLHRSNEKIRRRFTRQTLFVLVLCLVVAGSVAAITLINYIKGLFETKSVGVNNDGMLIEIENNEWYQQVDMDYIDLGNGNKLKVDYISLDEMSLYMVMDFQSEEDISMYTDIYFKDLKITNEKSDVICDKSNIFAEQSNLIFSCKRIENNKNNIKFLLYIYTNSMPISKMIKFEFSEIYITKKLDDKKVTDNRISFNIELEEKFLIRNYTLYNSEEANIEKAIISKTGFYALVKLAQDEVINKIELIDENNVLYECNFIALNSSSNGGNFEYMIIGNIYNEESNLLRLLINDKEYKLTK